MRANKSARQLMFPFNSEYEISTKFDLSVDKTGADVPFVL